MKDVVVMMKWLSSLFDKKGEDVTLPYAEGKVGKDDIGHANIDNHKYVKKDEVKETLGKNPLLDLKELELRDLSKHQIDALEQWCRRLINDIFEENYGRKYIEAEVQPGQPLIKASIKRTIEERRRQDPTRCPRWIDGIVMEDLEYFICRDDLYNSYFKGIFEPFYSVREEIRSVLQRLTAIRNRIAHGNAVSVHEAEQALCYSNDIINCCKMYYEKIESTTCRYLPGLKIL